MPSLISEESKLDLIPGRKKCSCSTIEAVVKRILSRECNGNRNCRVWKETAAMALFRGWLKRGPLRGPLRATSSAGSHANRLTTHVRICPGFQLRRCSQRGLALGRGSLRIDGLGRPYPKRSATDPVNEQQADPHEQQDGSAQTKSTDSIII
jgi:hypothetical protein